MLKVHCLQDPPLNSLQDHAMGDSHLQLEIDAKASTPVPKIGPAESFDPHTTKWSDINLLKFGALIVASSTLENGIFYP